MLLWLPEGLVGFIMKRTLASKTMAIKIGHAEHARGEMSLLAEEFRALNASSQLPTPAMDQLFGYFPDD